MTTNLFGLERHQFIMLVVAASVASCFSILFLWGSLTTADPEGKMMAVAFGGIGAAFLLPFWGLLRGRVPLWCVVSIIVTVLLGIMQINAWAADEAQDHMIVSRFYEYWPLLLFSLPGFFTLYRANGHREPGEPAV